MQESKFEKEYPLETPSGVYALFEDYFYVKVSAYDKSDFDAIDLLIDFEIAFNQIGTTLRQREAIYYVFVKDLTQREAAEKMGITQQAVHQLVWNVINKVSAQYRSDMYGVQGGFTT
ncbi:sigma factor-like helix-turn-helix DNA-binding protein [Halobacillus ihumii]|uniref:sigma factor-like helix-turn-helix DNA-binding protein n=1 Tax=Halobacillus ihumii TaxID=2686092 RepID=UPI0013CFF943|nr:sigma factor-like helix-turn-helix DNA-binding protein [Halobacillus ihumii]